MDHLPDPERRLQRDLDDLRALGLLPEVLNPRQPAGVERLAEFDIVFIRGGNTFVLRQALAETGADDSLRELLQQDALVDAGFSAGGCVLSPDLRKLSPIDAPSLLLDPIWTGLRLLDRPFVPHVDSPGHPETEACTRLSAQLRAACRPHWALRDGEVSVVEGGKEAVLP